jgi:hypothetical protein
MVLRIQRRFPRVLFGLLLVTTIIVVGIAVAIFQNLRESREFGNKTVKRDGLEPVHNSSYDLGELADKESILEGTHFYMRYQALARRVPCPNT